MQRGKIDLTDLLADESFLNYCRNSSAEDVAVWENYLLQNPGHRAAIDAAKEQFLLLFNELADFDLREQRRLLVSKLNQNELAPVVKMDAGTAKNSRKYITGWVKWTGVAAVLLSAIFLSVQYFSGGYGDGTRTYTTSLGERKNIQLPDGSVVNLNSGSEITIHKDFGVSSRDVFLKGEAFFDVKHDRRNPFIVRTAVMDIKALGTAFDVKAYQNEKVTATTLIRGLIEVTLKEEDNQVLLLHPHQKIEWQHKTPVIMRAAPPKAPESLTPTPLPALRTVKMTDLGDIKEIAWRDNKLIFEDDSLHDIARLLARWYGVQIIFENDEIKNYHFTGVFEKEDLQTVLSILKESKPFNFNIRDGDNMTVILSK